MLPIITFLVVMAFSAAGLYASERYRAFASVRTNSLNLHTFFILSTIIFQASKNGSYGETLAASLLATSVFIPLFHKLQRNMTDPFYKFLRLVFFYLLFAAIFQILQNDGVHPILVAAFILSTFVRLKTERWEALVMIVLIAFAGLVFSVIIPREQLFPELSPIVLPSVALALATASPRVFLKTETALTPVLTGAVVFFLVAVLFSPLSEIELRADLRLGVGIVFLIPMMATMVPVVNQRKDLSMIDFLLIAVAASLITVGSSAHESLALLLIPVTGLPAINTSTTVLMYIIQLFGLSAIVTLLKAISEESGELARTITDKTRLPKQTLTALAVPYAIISSVATGVTTMLTAAGCITIILIAVMIISSSKKKIALIPALSLLLLAFDILLLNFLPEISSVVGSPDQFTLLKTPTIILTITGAIVGLWLFVVKASRD